VKKCLGSIAVGNPVISVHFVVIQKLYKDENKHEVRIDWYVYKIRWYTLFIRNL